MRIIAQKFTSCARNKFCIQSWYMSARKHAYKHTNAAVAAVLIVFLLLSVMVFSASALLQRESVSSQAQASSQVNCYVGKPCTQQSCGGAEKVGNCDACNGGWCRGGACATCTGPGGSSGGSSGGDPNRLVECRSRGITCDIPACNASKGGNPARCSACGGGWCEGGICATCSQSLLGSAAGVPPARQPVAPSTPAGQSCTPGAFKSRYCDTWTAVNPVNGQRMGPFWVEVYYASDCSDDYRVTTGSCGEAETARPPAHQPTAVPTRQPTAAPTSTPQPPTHRPTEKPTQPPAQQPTLVPTQPPVKQPTSTPVAPAQLSPTQQQAPQKTPAQQPPTQQPTAAPTQLPAQQPTAIPTQQPTAIPTRQPTTSPTLPRQSPTPAQSTQNAGRITFTLQNSYVDPIVVQFICINQRVLHFITVCHHAGFREADINIKLPNGDSYANSDILTNYCGSFHGKSQPSPEMLVGISISGGSKWLTFPVDCSKQYNLAEFKPNI